MTLLSFEQSAAFPRTGPENVQRLAERRLHKRGAVMIRAAALFALLNQRLDLTDKAASRSLPPEDE